ncbi:MAG: LacI family transcriptional regulator [Anaerolinea sp.]|nr:LacI family transcriptional regulator [Anaerolinea sp.]
MKRVTIKDVALSASVSITTVSHVINNTRVVDPSTRQRVLHSMEALGYHPNNVARSLRSGVTKTIGLIVPDASNPFFAEVARKIEDYGYQQGYSVILGNSDNNPEKQTNYINTLLAKRVDGVIFISSGGDDKELLKFSESQIPVVVADRNISLELADVVQVDNEQAGSDATRYLIELGHKNIACITGLITLSPSMERIKGYEGAMKMAGIPVRQENIIVGDFTTLSGEKAMESLLAAIEFPTAVFCFNDMMAIGAMAAIRKAGLSIPGDVSIIGFDDIELASLVVPPLTTVAQPFSEIASYATDLLIERIKGNRTEANQRVVLKARLVPRESTGRRG